MGINNTLTEAEGDEVCWMVLRLCRAVRDEVKRDDIAPVDYRPYPCSDATLRAENLSGPGDAQTPPDLTGTYEEVPMMAERSHPTERVRT